AFGETAGDDDGADAALLFQLEHLADDAERFLPRWLDEAAGVDYDDVGAVGIGHERIAVLRELAQHALRIDKVLRTAKTNKRVSAFGMGHAAEYLGGSGANNNGQCEDSHGENVQYEFYSGAGEESQAGRPPRVARFRVLRKLGGSGGSARRRCKNYKRIRGVSARVAESGPIPKSVAHRRLDTARKRKPGRRARSAHVLLSHLRHDTSAALPPPLFSGEVNEAPIPVIPVGQRR